MLVVVFGGKEWKIFVFGGKEVGKSDVTLPARERPAD
jgi:hypothetical protein